MGNETCKVCKFFNEHGQCLRNAPMPIVVPMDLIQKQGPPNPMVLWPPVDPDGWCGEYCSKLVV